MPAEKHSSVRARPRCSSRTMASAFASVVLNTWALTIPAQFGAGSFQSDTFAAPVPDHRKLLGVLFAVQDATLALSMKRISWTSQLL
jgi:hypothetical protein